MNLLPRRFALVMLLAAFSLNSLALTGQRESLLIGPGDLLHLMVYDTPEMEQRARVTDAGSIPFSFIGSVICRRPHP